MVGLKQRGPAPPEAGPWRRGMRAACWRPACTFPTPHQHAVPVVHLTEMGTDDGHRVVNNAGVAKLGILDRQGATHDAVGVTVRGQPSPAPVERVVRRTTAASSTKTRSRRHTCCPPRLSPERSAKPRQLPRRRGQGSARCPRPRRARPPAGKRRPAGGPSVYSATPCVRQARDLLALELQQQAARESRACATARRASSWTCPPTLAQSKEATYQSLERVNLEA